MTFAPGEHIVYQIYRTEARFGYFVCESDMLDCHGRNAGYVWIGVFACESAPHGETTIVRKDLIRKATRADFETFRHQIPRDFKEPSDVDRRWSDKRGSASHVPRVRII